MADKLAILNDALAHLGERSLASLTEPREPQRVLDALWPIVVPWCLELQPWSFATRRVGFGAAVGDDNPTGYANAFRKPVDWVRTADVALDAGLTQPLTDYVDEAGYWYADPDTICVRYVSNDPAWGADPNRWPASFAEVVALRLAERAAARIKGLDAKNSDETIAGLVALRERAMQEATDAEAAKAARVFHDTEQAGETRLQVFNDALAYLGRPRLHALTDARSDVRDLADQWRSCVRWCLAQAPWTFAARVQTLPVSTDAIAKGTFANAVNKPADWVTTLDLASDAALSAPLDAYAEDSRHWLCDPAGLSVRYVSADPAWGLDSTRWPPAFTDLLALRLSEKVAPRLGMKAEQTEALGKQVQGAVGLAASIEAEAQARVIVPVLAAEVVRLAVYNASLQHLGRMRIGSRTSARSEVRDLNDAWDHAVRWCLEQGPWTFAIRAIMIGPFGSAEPTFGYAQAFRKPDDWVQTALVSGDEKFRAGLINYADETGWWFADLDGLYVQYVSSGPAYGMALERWPASFRDLLALRLAELAAGRIDPARMDALQALRLDAMKRQRATDALNTPPRFPPPSGWATARRAGRSGGRPYQGSGGPAQPFTGDTALSGDSDLPINADFVPRISG